MIRSLMLFTLALGLLLAPLPSAAQSLDATPTATAQPDERPDACEPNGSIAQACTLEIDTVSGPFTFLPEGDQDFYSVFLGAEPDGLETTVAIRATNGLDLLTTVSRADTRATLDSIASPAISTTIPVDVTGWVVLRVENRAAGIASGQSYRIEVRKTIPAAPSVTPTPNGPEGLEREAAQPDALENNWSIETAAPIGVGVLYDLTFVCPVAGGCAGGDHDYLAFEVKAGGRYLLSTFDLADGVDTVLDLFWRNQDGQWAQIAANDDAFPGEAFLSVLRWQAPSDGQAIIRIAPREGGLNPILLDAPSYRFAVALAESSLAAQIEARIASQGNQPTPTATSAPASGGTSNPNAPAASAPEAPAVNVAPATAVPITNSASPGTVILLEEANVYAAPDATSAWLATLTADSMATLTGNVSGIWAEISSDAFIGNAWIDRRVLRPFALAPTPALGDNPVQPIPTTMASQLPGGTTRPTVPTVPGQVAPAITPTAAPVTNVSLRVSVSIRTTSGAPVVDMRVSLVNTFGDEYVPNVTRSDGTAQLTHTVPSGTAVYVVVPALGVRVPVDAAKPTINLVIPEGGM